VPIYRVALIREATLLWPRPQFRNSEDVAGFVRQAIGDTDREHFVVIMLDRKHRLIGANTVSIGSATASVVHPREVFKPALAPTPEQALWQQTVVHNAVAVLFGHNHPSGDPAPSQEDRALTQRLVDCGKLLGIQVLDHVIVGDGTSAYLSFADQSLL
jgi:DNA repair protein RadC